MRPSTPLFRAACAGALALLATAATAHAQAEPPVYHVRDMGPLLEEVLPPVQWPSSDARGLNEDGDLVGEAWLDGGRMWGFLYTVEHGITVLPNIPGWSSSAVRDVSDRDATGEILIVGGSTYGVHTDIAIGEAVLWRVSTVTGQVLETRTIGVLPGYDEAMATGVNGNGTVVGFCNLSGPWTAFKYDVVTDSFTSFPFPARPLALNELDEVVGGAWLGDLFGNYTHVGDPPEWTTASISGMNEIGGVCGRAATGQSDGTGHYLVAVVYKHLGVWGNFDVCCWNADGHDINNHGDAISWSELHHAATDTDYGLGSLLAPEFHGDYVPGYAAALNDNLQVVATYGDALLLTPLGSMIIPGDVNGDAVVDADDYCAWVEGPIDLDGDGDIDPDDEQWLIDRLLVFGYSVDDCNGNGLSDHCEIADGLSADCDGNDVPDECQVDCSGDGIPDVCEADCNGNGIADPCDIAQGTSSDCNFNGVPDECDQGGPTGATAEHDPPLQLLEGSVMSFDLPVFDAGIVDDLRVTLDLRYRIGNLTVRLTHGITTITLIDRPGYPDDSSLGNSQLGYDIILDDEGSGGPIEEVGNFGPPFEPIVSPPSYVPDTPLSTFDGMPSEGVWTLTVITTPDSSPVDELWGWGVEIVKAGVPVPPCDTVGTTYCFCDGSGPPAPCGNTGSPGSGCANSSNPLGAFLTAQGSASVGSDDLELVTTGARSSQPGLYFSALNATNGGQGFAFGDGLRCAGGGVVRLGTVVSDPEGDSSSGTGIAAATGASAGDVRRFQFWFRDPGFACTGEQFNLTNGLEVVWIP